MFDLEIAAIVDYLVSHRVPLEAENLEKLAVREKAAVRTIMQQNDQPWVGFNFSVVFAKFLEQVPEWGLTSPEVAVFFKNPAYENHPYLQSLCHQTTGNCSGAHASVQLLHYLMDIRSNGSADVGSVDITAHMQLSELVGEELLKYLTGKKHTKPLFYFAALGSLNVQRMLCLRFNLPYADEEHIARNLDTAAYIMEQLQFQPGLVTNFTVSSAFMESQLVSFTGLPDFEGGENAELAMLIIGARRAGSNYFFLLQNWHAHKQFLEVSAGYLAHCFADVHFVRPEQVITLAHATPLIDEETDYDEDDYDENDYDEE